MMPDTVKYKAHSVRDPFCTLCNTFLSGDGSMVLPYKCECGTYEYDWHDNKLKLIGAKPESDKGRNARQSN